MLRRHFINVSYSKDIKPNEIWYRTSNGMMYDMQLVTDALSPSLSAPQSFTLLSNTQKEDNWWCLTFLEPVIHIGGNDEDGCLYPIFYGSNDILGGINSNILYVTEVKLPNSVTSIGAWAVSACTALISIVIPDGVTSIGERAFNYCSSLTSIILPNSVKSIGRAAFMDCSSLTSIVIGNGVTSIGDNAFYRCKGLTSITISNGVTSIGDEAFQDCSSLISVTIPNSVTSIGNFAFYYCSSLNAITFEGTIEQWNTVTKGTSWNYDVPATVVHCTDGDVAI